MDLKIIKYSDIQFMNTVNSLSSSINAIETSPASASMGSSNMEAMKQFIELYELMGRMMAEYKELQNLDRDSLKAVGNAMKQQDLDVRKLWK